mgnify:CR=1 FL=1
MAKPKVFVTRLIPEPGLDLLKQDCDVQVWPEELPPSREALLAGLAEAEGLLSLLTDKIDAVLLDAAPSLKVVSNYAVGYDNISVPDATARGILVCNKPGVLSETTADLAWSLLMASARRLAEGYDYVRTGKWKTWGPRTFLGWDVHHATLGIVGLGRIGFEMAKRARGFDMKVLYTNRTRKEEFEAMMGLEWAPLEQVLEESDFITLHTPLNDETRHLLGAAQFKQMKSTAVLINTARGQIVDQVALYEALKSGEIAYAALDVTDPEPIAPDDPLLSLPNCLIVPHIGSASHATRNRMAVMAAENLLAALKGERPENLVNPDVWKNRKSI